MKNVSKLEMIGKKNEKIDKNLKKAKLSGTF